MEMVNGDVGRESGNRVVVVYRYTVIWTGSDIGEEAYGSVNVIDLDTDEVRASDNGVEKASGICSSRHLVSGFESASRIFVDLENLGGRISP
jgi:hypothetical protein